MAEDFAKVGEIEICFETFGSSEDPAMLLVMGLGTQMVAWPEGFCRRLAGRGFHVIRYDNRDIGRSTHLRGLRAPTIRQLLLRDKSAARYSLADMAADGIGLLDWLGIERAHVVGVSMGGMIAQTMAARHPDRVLSLASIMSNTGHRCKGTPGLRIYPIFLRRPAPNREGAIESTVSIFRLIGSPGFPFDEAEARKAAGLSYDRGYNPAGTGPPARRDPRRRRPHARAARDQGADGGHPRHEGQDGAPVRRPRDRRRDPRRAAGHDRGHGPRPAARRMGPDGRRHRGKHAVGGRLGRERRGRVACRGRSRSGAASAAGSPRRGERSA
jgi:pimeloyl-ACP methyl ester carboxylesterase